MKNREHKDACERPDPAKFKRLAPSEAFDCVCNMSSALDTIESMATGLYYLASAHGEADGDVPHEVVEDFACVFGDQIIALKKEHKALFQGFHHARRSADEPEADAA